MFLIYLGVALELCVRIFSRFHVIEHSALIGPELSIKRRPVQSQEVMIITHEARAICE